MKLTNTQKQLIIESLLYAVCPEISADWQEEHIREMTDLAIALKDENTQLNNICLYKFSKFEVETTTVPVLDAFKDILNIKEDKSEHFLID